MEMTVLDEVPMNSARSGQFASEVDGHSLARGRAGSALRAEPRKAEWGHSLLAKLIVIAGLLLAADRSPAVTILSGPAFTPSTNAPLTGVLSLTTDVPSRVSVSVNEGTNFWVHNFYDFSTTHAEPLYGFMPNRTNLIAVTVYDQQRNRASASQAVTFITSPLPTNFPSITVLKSQPALMEPGYTLFMVQVHGGVYWWGTIVDAAGNVVWYSVVPSTLDIQQLENGDLFMPWTTNFNEINLLGQTVNTWLAPTNLPVNEHEGLPTDHGTILYLSDATEVVSNYPTSMTVSNAPLATASIVYQKVVEISATNSTLLNTWSPISLLQPTRISYLITKTTGGWDAEHSNTILEDPSDNSIIVSIRHQNAIVKFSRATGKLVWILGPPDNWGAAWKPYLLKPVGSPFVWFYGQHAPVITPQGTLLIHDNGNYRASPYVTAVANASNYTRAVEYSINEQTMQVSQVWDYGRTNMAQRLFSDHEGNAEPQPQTGNVLIGFANVEYVNGVAPSIYGSSATMTRITEVTHTATPQIVFDLAISMFNVTNAVYKDCSIYRCHRIPDLYGHPPMPVGDLSINYSGQAPVLLFSGDDIRTYVIQASPDLVNWTTIGEGLEDAQQDGEFSFEDDVAYGVTARYYRVLTQ